MASYTDFIKLKIFDAQSNREEHSKDSCAVHSHPKNPGNLIQLKILGKKPWKIQLTSFLESREISSSPVYSLSLSPAQNQKVYRDFYNYVEEEAKKLGITKNWIIKDAKRRIGREKKRQDKLRSDRGGYER